MLKFLWPILTIVSFFNLPLAFGQSNCIVNAKYRTFDGTCFDLKRPVAGAAGTPYSRLFPSNYSDGVAAVRRSAAGTELPGARYLSAKLSDHSKTKSGTMFIMQWGQFIDHDIALTKVQTFTDGTGIQCCSKPQLGRLLVPPPSPECLAIEIPPYDQAYGNPQISKDLDINCMSFVRSQFNQPIRNGPRQQINSNTHWLDGSHIYGSSKAVANSLRNPLARAGQLRTSTDAFRRSLLPLSTRCCPNDPTNSCPAAARCFDAGDARLNQHATLTTLHTIWLREHNRVANEMKRLYPGNNITDDFLYHEARRVVIAELQHITYTEYLPTIIGRELADQVMAPRSTEDQNIDPSILTEFNTAAYRMGHSQIKSFIELFEPDGTLSEQSFFLANSLQASGGPFFPDRQGFLNPRFIDNSIRGLLKSSVEIVDSFVAKDIHSRMFRLPDNPLGFDLISINIQRGRDHGLPSYATVRGIKTFEEMYPITPKDTIGALKTIYTSVYDIDLYIGGLTETPLPGASVGPTFATIIAKQFRNLRVTDRFFYDDLSQSVSFTPNQLAEIQKTSLARIICSNSDGTFLNIQPNAFQYPNGLNAPTSCNNIPGINFKNWL